MDALLIVYKYYIDYLYYVNFQLMVDENDEDCVCVDTGLSVAGCQVNKSWIQQPGHLETSTRSGSLKDKYQVRVT